MSDMGGLLCGARAGRAGFNVGMSSDRVPFGGRQHSSGPPRGEAADAAARTGDAAGTV